MANFFEQPMIPSTVPAPEPPGFNLLRQMLMNKAFQGNSNPYGLNPDYKGGASGVYTNGQNRPFDPYGGGGQGWHNQGFGPAQQGPQQGGGGQGGGNFMQFIQQLMQQMQGGGGRPPMTQPMRAGGMATPPAQSPDMGNQGPPDHSRQGGQPGELGPPPSALDSGYDGMTHYDGDGCTGYDGDPYSGWQPGRYSTPQSIKPKEQSADSGGVPPASQNDNQAGGFAPQSVWISGQSGYDGMKRNFGNRTSAGPKLGGPSGGMRTLGTLLDQLRPSRGPSPAARIGVPIRGLDPIRGGLR